MRLLQGRKIQFIIIYLPIEKIQSNMFTVGIFSTHIPYLAFVFFYVYFFIFGVQKASNGELSSYEKTILSESRLIHQFDHSANKQNFHYHEFYAILNPNVNRKIQFEKKIKQGCFIRNQINNPNFTFSFFNRPPPAA
jgi:hypothetical protein